MIDNHVSLRLPAILGLSLLEVLIVVAVIGVLAGMVVTSFSPSSTAKLQAAASVLGQEIEYARSLAVNNSDNYKITFDLANNRWVLTHSGANTSLDALPITPFHLPSDAAKEQVVSLDGLPSLGGPVRLHAVWALTSPPTAVTDLEFSPLGGTARGQGTLSIWLATGTGANARYISVRVHPVTGLFWVENYQSAAPTTAGFVAAANL